MTKTPHYPNLTGEPVHPYDEGRRAFLWSEPRDANPYPRTARDEETPFADWERGWADEEYNDWKERRDAKAH